MSLFRTKSDRIAPKSADRRRRRPALEALEGRQLLSLGTELAGNVFTGGEQRVAANASAPDGRSVVAWVDGTSSSNRGIEFRLFNSSGSPTTSDISVPGSGGATPDHPSVAMDSQGDFVVVWAEPLTSSGTNILAQRFNASGSPVGSNIFIATSSKDERSPDVAMDKDGNFVVAYERTGTSAQDTDVIVRRYSSAGSFLGEVDVQSSSSYNEQRPSVAMAADGRFAVAYEWNHFGSTDSHIWATTHLKDGTRHRGFGIAGSVADEENPDVAMNNFGDLVVAYTELVGGDRDVKAHRATFDGPVGDEIHINGSVDDEFDPQVAMNRTGRSFVVAYDARNVSSGSVAVGVVEISSTNVRTKQPTIQGGFNAGVSMGPNGQYLVTYQRKVGADENIFRRRGTTSTL